MPLTSNWFADNERCQQCAVIDAKHILQGDTGFHVYLVQQALIMLDGSKIHGAEADAWHYGPSTCDAVLKYKQARKVINHSYQQTADDIVGKMTIASLDGGMSALETRVVFLGGAGFLLKGIVLAGPRIVRADPKLVVVTEVAQPWSKWADQVVAAHKNRSAKVAIPNGQSPAAVAGAYKRAASLAGPGGTVVISVGHGIPDATSDEDGRFDLGPKGSFIIGGRNALLVGGVPPRNVPKEKLVFHHTSVFYDESPPRPRQSGKEDDLASGTASARQRLANWKAYEDICTAFKNQKLAAVVMLTCRVTGSIGLIKKVAGQWGCPIVGYGRRIAGLELPNRRARVWEEGDAPGTNWINTTNTPYSETFYPLSRDTLQVSP
jgi:hypothetical protein